MSALTWLALAPAALAAPWDSPGPRSHWEVLVQPATYTSAEGTFRFHVRSLARDWRAGGHVRMERGGELAFERDLAVVPWDAIVLDDGRAVVVGFQDHADTRSGDLVVALLDAAGEVAWQHVEARQAGIIGMGTRATYRPPAFGVQVEAGEVLVELDPIKPRRDGTCWVRTLELERGRDLGSSQRTVLPERRASVPPAPQEAAGPRDDRPLVALEALPTLPLALPEGAATLPESLASIEAFGFDEDGRIGILSSVDGAVIARTLDRAGKVVATVRFGSLGFELDYRCATSLGPRGTWLVSTPNGGRVVRLDLERGSAETVLRHERSIEALLAFRDGGFALLESRGGLHCFDAAGRPVVVESTEGALAEAEPRYHLLGRSASGDGIAVASPSEWALQVTLLTDGGRTRRHVTPPLHAGAEFDRYGDAVVQTRAGSFGLATHGSSGSTLVERDFAGNIVGRFEPLLPDGTEFPFDLGSLDVAPDGTLGSANSHVVATYSLSEGSGVSLGRRFEPISWNSLSRWDVAPDGRIAVVAGDRSAALFEPDGRASCTLCAPTTQDEPYGELGFDGSGVIWWPVSSIGPFVCFGADGTYLGVRRLGARERAVQFCGEGTARWSTDQREVVRIDAEGAAVETLAQRPDGAWWRDVRDLAASADGRRLAVADVLRAGGREEGGFLALYDFDAGAAWFVDGPDEGHVSMAGDWVTWGRTLVHLPTRALRTLPEHLRAIPTPRGPELWRLVDVGGQDQPPVLEVRRFALPRL